MQGVVYKFLSWCLSYVPTKKVICFNSFPDYSDNAFALFKCMCDNKRGNDYKLVWLINDKGNFSSLQKIINQDYPGIFVYKKSSLRGIYNYIISRYVFYTHGILGSLNLKQHSDKFINLWHGMPLKKIGLLEQSGIHRKTVPNVDYTIATSRVFVKLMAGIFGIPEKSVLCVGQPRNDLLNIPTDYFEKAGLNITHYKKIGIWLPTYRYSINSHEQRQDGDYHEGFIGFCNQEDLKELDTYLKVINHLLLIKIHPMDKMQFFKFEKFTNIHIIKPQNFNSQLYPLLGKCDYMLTDFSSVMFDYEILERPMGFVCPDIEKYSANRGFVFYNVREVMPGPIINNLEELKSFITNNKYITPSIEFNLYKDSMASKRILDFLKIY